MTYLLPRCPTSSYHHPRSQDFSLWENTSVQLIIHAGRLSWWPTLIRQALLNARDFPSWSQKRKSEILEAWEGFSMRQVFWCWEGDGAIGQGPENRNQEQFPVNTQQKDRDFSLNNYNGILPTRMGLEEDPEFQMRKQPADTDFSLSGEPSLGVLDIWLYLSC